MDIHAATETAYNNGYEKGFKDGQATARPKGKWMINSEKFSNIYDNFYCSNCNNYTEERNPYKLGEYCSFCGAKMINTVIDLDYSHLRVYIAYAHYTNGHIVIIGAYYTSAKASDACAEWKADHLHCDWTNWVSYEIE